MIGTLRIAIMGLTALSLAVPVGALAQEDRPADRPRLARYVGEITGVVPGRGTFTLATRDGQELEFATSDRTRFRSRDGSVEDIHDLKKGMLAMVGAVHTQDGSLLALIVAVGKPKDRPELDLRAVGEVVAVSSAGFTLQKRDGEQLSLAVNENTKFKGIGGFDQLQIGMVAAVGAVEADDGWLALWVGARERRPDRSERERQRTPESRPVPPTPEPDEQEISA